MTVDSDDTIRPETSVDNLAKLKPVFKKGGSVTAGNSCQARARPLGQAGLLGLNWPVCAEQAERAGGRCGTLAWRVGVWTCSQA